MIGVLDEAGNVIESTSTRAISKSGKRKAKQTAATPMKHDG
jgi:hypothetical protein